MLDFLFGGSKRLALIKELLEQRMREEGYDEMQYKLQVKKMGRLELSGTPEATVLTIIDTVKKGQASGELLYSIVSRIENIRKVNGHNPIDFNEVLAASKGSSAGESVFMYCKYRVDLEHWGVMNDLQIARAIDAAVRHL